MRKTKNDSSHPKIVLLNVVKFGLYEATDSHGLMIVGHFLEWRLSTNKCLDCKELASACNGDGLHSSQDRMQLCSGAAPSEGKQPGKIWKNTCVHRGVTSSSSAALKRISCASSAIAWVSFRISSSKFTVPIRESLCLHKASFVRKCHRSACIRCKIECPTSTKACKAMPGYQQRGFSPWENRWPKWKGPVIMKKKFFQPTSPSFFHCIALTGKHLICCNISWCLCPFN